MSAQGEDLLLLTLIKVFQEAGEEEYFSESDKGKGPTLLYRWRSMQVQQL